MLVLVLCILALASPALFGGKISRLSLVQFRAWWLLLAALLAQILIIEIFPDADRTLLEAVHMGTYVAAGVFVAVNWRIPGLVVIAAGGALNGITIALNGGQLPASKPALQMAGIDVGKGEFVNSGVIQDPVLPLLGDIFVWPEPLPFANVFSFGDALIVLGTFYGAHKIAGSRLVKRAWEPASAVAEGEPAQVADAPPVGHAPTQALTQAPPGPGARATRPHVASSPARRARHAATSTP
jgi:hypothetical protein